MNATYDNLTQRVGVSVLERLNKLLNLSNLGNNENEALAATQAAMSLLAKYELSRDDLRVYEEGKVEPINLESVAAEGSYESWRNKLWGAVARAHFCYLHCDRDRQRYVITGRDANRRAAVMLASHLECILEAWADEKLSDYRGWEKPEVVRGGLCHGFVDRVQGRLIEQKDRLIREAEGPERGLVLAKRYDEAQEEARRFLESVGVRLIPGRADANQMRSGAGYQLGRSYGDSVELEARHQISGRVGA